MYIRLIENYPPHAYDTLATDMERAFAIRREVFIEEQEVPEDDDFDGLDNIARHAIVLTNEDKAIGTARFRVIERDGIEKIKLERFAVLKPYRGRGIGLQLVKFILEQIEKDSRYNHIKTIYLHAQLDAVSLYDRAGFEKEGDIFDESGILHYKMVLKK